MGKKWGEFQSWAFNFQWWNLWPRKYYMFSLASCARVSLEKCYQKRSHRLKVKHTAGIRAEAHSPTWGQSKPIQAWFPESDGTKITWGKEKWTSHCCLFAVKYTSLTLTNFYSCFEFILNVTFLQKPSMTLPCSSSGGWDNSVTELYALSIEQISKLC